MVRLGKLAELSVTGWALLHRKALLLLLLCCCWGLPAHPAAIPDVDFCASCHSSATCFQESGKSFCICNYGFIGNGRTYCNDKDECLIGAYNICGNHSACHNTYGSFYCTCHEGFQPSNNNSNNTYIPNDGTYCKAVDCGFPLALPNTFIDSENKTTFGSNVTYKCQKGFVFEAGSSSTHICTADGNWEGSTFICTAVDCGFPLALPNTFIDSENKTTFGSNVTYKCQKGFVSEAGSSSTHICTADGNWEGSAFICTAVDCGFPLALPNTFIDSENKTTFGSNVTYKCQKGFVSEAGSSSTHICTADGKWEGSAFICTEIDCGRPPLVKHSIITMDHTTLFGSKAEYHCVEGFYSKSGTNASICTEHGVWQPPTLSCKAVDCGAPPPLPNTSVLPQSNNTTYGSVVVYECQHGYAIESGNQSAVCTARGEWEGTDLVCRAVDCGAPPSFPNVLAGPHSNTTYGSAIVYECHNGYIAESGIQTAVCNGRGQWEGADLVCTAVDCGAPPSFPNVSAGLHSNTTYGSAIVYECHNGYIAESGNQTAVCNGQGQWEGADLVCTAIDCGSPPLIPHAKLSWDNSTGVGSVALYTCEKGFRRTDGRNLSHCTSNGSWEVPDVICKEEPSSHVNSKEEERGTTVQPSKLKRRSELPAAKADIISNLSIINETCVKWRKATGRAGWKILYLVNIAGARWYQKEIFHKIIFNFTTDAMTPMVCLRLRPGTNYTVNITAASPDGAILQATLTIKTAAIDCGSPPLIPHANLSWDNSTGVGSVASYMCEKGFRRTDGRNLSHCTSNGSWELPDVICKEINCGIPQRMPHSDLVWSGRSSLGSIARYLCKKGFKESGGRNYSLCTEEGVWEESTLTCTVKKFKINVTALNETCLQWRSADGERLYLLHVRGHRWYQEDFFHEMERNFTTDPENPVVCLNLRPGTNYTVNITAASSKSMVDFFVTTRIADPPLPDLKFVETQGPAPKLSLRRAEEKNGPISSYQVLVLPFFVQSRLDCNSLVRSSFFSNVTNTEGYVAAEILSKDFVHHLEFSLGDRRYYGDFYNAPLRRGQDYCVVLRITSEWNQERAQSCMAWAQIKELSTTRQHMTVVGLGSLAVVCFFLFISFSAARCCKRR